MSDGAWILLALLVAVPAAWVFLELRDRGHRGRGNEGTIGVEVDFGDGGGDGGGGDGGGGGD